jgi:3-deoxy-D-manno-octulosonate 8-phosphate phosphatase (KDO 8-P phosphatase)
MKNAFKNISELKMIFFDFDGVFTNNKVYISENNIEMVVCNRSDGIGLSRLREIGIDSMIISTEKNPVVLVRANKLKIKCIQGVEDKSKTIIEVCKNLGIDIKHTMFVGNDINDIPALKIVGMPVGVKDSYPEIDKYIKFKTKNNGGEGAVREISDLVYNNFKIN